MADQELVGKEYSVVTSDGDVLRGVWELQDGELLLSCAFTIGDESSLMFLPSRLVGPLIRLLQGSRGQQLRATAQ